jgi:hypothetical protein
MGKSPFLMGKSQFLKGKSPFLMGISPFLKGKSPFLMGKSPFLMGKSPFLKGKSTINGPCSIAIFRGGAHQRRKWSRKDLWMGQRGVCRGHVFIEFGWCKSLYGDGSIPMKIQFFGG